MMCFFCRSGLTIESHTVLHCGSYVVSCASCAAQPGRVVLR